MSSWALRCVLFLGPERSKYVSLSCGRLLQRGWGVSAEESLSKAACWMPGLHTCETAEKCQPKSWIQGMISQTSMILMSLLATCASRFLLKIWNPEPWTLNPEPWTLNPEPWRPTHPPLLFRGAAGCVQTWCRKKWTFETPPNGTCAENL